MLNKHHLPSKSQRGLRDLLVYGLTACLFSLVLIFWLATPLNRDWEDRFQTNYYLMRSIFSEPRVSPLPLVVILIDDNSLPAGSPRSPIDRQWLTQQLRKINQQQPALIVLNILLDRPTISAVDQELVQVIKESGNVILKDDPIYPVRAAFAKAAQDRGSIRFRLDSAGNLQEVCNQKSTCQDQRILHHRIWKNVDISVKRGNKDKLPSSSWMKINFFSEPSALDSSPLTTFPVIRTQDLDSLSPDALKGKLVLIGTGFSEIYPLFRIPLGSPPIELQETLILGHLLHMMAGNLYFSKIHRGWVALFAFLLMMALLIITIFRGPLTTTVTGLVFIIAYFLVCSIGFAFYHLEVPFILPVLIVLIYILGSILYQSVRDRFNRLELELLLKEKQIAFLTNELHTHHLFNEFSRISVMIKHRPESAREYLIEFAEMLRLSLKYGDQRHVPISVQMEFIDLYIRQQEIIHQDRISFDLSLDAGRQGQITAPWHTFFPLVENAVKYTESFQKPNSNITAKVRIELIVSDRSIQFITENPFDSSPISSTQTGLENLRKRLILAYPGGDFQLESSSEGQQWISQLVIPIS